MLFFVINSYCKTKPACCDLPCSAILLKAAGTAGEQEGFCELCPIGVQGEPPTFCSAAHCPSCTCSLCFCNVLSKLGFNLETGRMCFGCAQNQEFQISSKSDKGASHFPLSRWKDCSHSCGMCVLGHFWTNVCPFFSWCACVCEPQVLIMHGPDYSSLKQKIKQQEADRSWQISILIVISFLAVSGAFYDSQASKKTNSYIKD